MPLCKRESCKLTVVISIYPGDNLPFFLDHDTGVGNPADIWLFVVPLMGSIPGTVPFNVSLSNLDDGIECPLSKFVNTL